MSTFFTVTVHSQHGTLLVSATDDSPARVVDFALTSVLEHGSRHRVLAQVTDDGGAALWVLGTDLSRHSRQEAVEELDAEGVELAGRLYWCADHAGRWAGKNLQDLPPR